MNSIDDIFGVDEEKERHGVWIEAKGPKGNVQRFLIAAYDSEEHMALFRERTAAHRLAMRSGVANDDELEKIGIACLAEKVLLDWSGVLDSESGKAIPYSKAEGVKSMSKNHRFKAFIMEHAQRLELFRKDEREQTEKN